MSCITPINSDENNSKKIYLGGTIWDEFTYEYYNDKKEALLPLFKKYTDIAVGNIYNPSVVNERKSNMENAAYKDKHNWGVYIPSEKSELSQSMNVDHWQQWLHNKIEWLQFQGILEHAAFHTTDNNILLH